MTGRVIFSSITRTVVRHRREPMAGVRRARARRTSNPNERAADDRRTFKHGRFSVLNLHPFRRASLQRTQSVRARTEKPTEQNPPVRFSPFPSSYLRPSTLCLRKVSDKRTRCFRGGTGLYLSIVY